MLLDYNFRNYNYRLFLYVLLLNITGVLIIRSASNQDISMVVKQIVGILAGLTAVIILSLVDYHKVVSFAPLIYGASLAFLLAVLVFGVSRGVARRWLVLPVIGQIQPSEFVKIGLIVFFAWYLSKYQERVNQFRILFFAGLLFLAAFGLIFLQPNLSTSLVTMVIFLCMLFAAGLSYRWILGALAVVVPCGALFIYLLQYNMVPFLQDYQVRRIMAFIDPANYAEANLQQNNSIMAIGSGMLQGKGLNNNTLASVKNGNFLSEEQTDFIFAVIGEELGFIGCMAVIFLIALTVYECLIMAARAKDLMGSLLCVGLASLLAFQSFANIAVATGILPNTGLPLPFISYGVSSLLSVYLGVGVVMNVGLQRKVSN
ncbi:FtsW/RodA/SpoVE family cell cycle protein [Clostridium sp. AM42-4]|uniref:FtsW/RodA/SpoVE family cell cycle protein n=1 Tax=Clostridium sp. AM42-4 TaxID=2292305 RepID=UPI000E4CCE1D|nr:FtsW/RodA/SpoVE family cell cycle protein [Clostridium sp. AM42-4]RHS84375.1 rod shape-determining protein RodA [Clostridium sp. AM42-4]